MKKVLLILLCVVVVLGAGVGFVLLQAKKTFSSIEAGHAALSAVNLSALGDGVYHATFGGIPVSVKLDVTVREHAITDIAIRKQSCGKGYEAKATIPAILQAQQPKVDAVAGATMSSKCIMVAVSRALQTGAK